MPRICYLFFCGSRDMQSIDTVPHAGLPDGKIVDIASGRAHSLVIVDDKVVRYRKKTIMSRIRYRFSL